MFFLAIALLGIFAWYRVPIELMPALSGEQLFVNYARPGSEPDVVEREILVPLESRIGELPGVVETWGEINGSTGTLSIEFAPGSNHKIRELELQRLAAELARSQPEGTSINVSSQDMAQISRFAMIAQVTGGDDANSLRDFVENQIQTRVESIPGVSRVFVTGGAPREVTVWLDYDLCAELGIQPTEVSSALQRSVRGLRYLGSAEENKQRFSVLLDGRPGGIVSLGDIRIKPDSPILLRHVAEIEMGTTQQTSVFRINGEAAVGLIVFQDEGANLVQLGEDVRARLASLEQEFSPFGVGFVIGFDAAQTVQDQLQRLQQLAISGFLIALLVLFLFLRELRAVAVVAIAVPISLLAAGAMLFLSGYTLNLVTLTGLVIGVGMLVDNSIVVYEAVQRSMERGGDSLHASIAGIRRTIRAILAASATNAVVFLPPIYIIEDSLIRGLLINMVAAIMLPLAASLLVAIGLVPLLAQRLAAPAALRRLQRASERRREYGGSVSPQRARELFSGFLKIALRRPAPWISGIFVIILLTSVFALPWVLINSAGQPAPEASQVTIEVEFDGGGSLSSAGIVFERLEQAALTIDGVERVESNYQEDQGSLTVHLVAREERPADVNASRIRSALNDAVEDMSNVQVRPVANAGGVGGGPGGGDLDELLGSGSLQIAVSGPDMLQLNRIAGELQDRLTSIPQIESAEVSTREGSLELLVEPRRAALAAYQLNPEDIMNPLRSSGREGQQMQVGFTLPDGREIPMTVKRQISADSRSLQDIQSLRILTEAGVLPLGELVTGSLGQPPPAIVHHNGRREINVEYRLDENTSGTGPERLALEEEIENVIASAFRPSGFTIETAGAEATTSWMRLVVVPILFFLFAVLAITFESLTMPFLVLIAVPLTVFGITWALFFAGLGIDPIAGIGIIVLLGLTVNPAILLVDRMQQKLRLSQCGGGAAALTAVRERVRPVLMTSCTTIAGLWPLALSTGQEFEIWPPFATVVMGGLVASTFLTLLVIPVGFVLFARVDRIFGRLGAWILMLWVGATAAVIAPLVITGQLESITWQIVTTLLVAGFFLWIIVRVFLREPVVMPKGDSVVIETHYLSKIYGLPGPVGRAWHRCNDFYNKFNVRSFQDSKDRAITFFLLLIGAFYLAANLQTLFWRVVFSFIAAAFFSRMLIELRQILFVSRKSAPAKSKQAARLRSRFDRLVLTITPWAALGLVIASNIILPVANGAVQLLDTGGAILLGFILFIAQFGRSTASRVADGKLLVNLETGRLRRLRSSWRLLCMRTFGLDLPREEFTALSSVHFRAERGMIGILGPNGAGKTTFLRLLASVLEPSVGAIHYGNIEKRKLGESIGALIGYLPQEFGLPDHMTAREYLDYFAILYQVGDREQRNARVEKLLGEVGLFEKQHEKIKGFSGGQRQRVAVARTLLREPPIIIVDEPTVGLDPRERIRFRNLLAKLAKGRVVLFSTHVVEDVAVSCERVVVLKRGSLVYDGKPEDLAEYAKGRVWELKAPESDAAQIEKRCKIITQIPEENALTRFRVLSTSKPGETANIAEPNLEDGYLQLIHGDELPEVDDDE